MKPHPIQRRVALTLWLALAFVAPTPADAQAFKPKKSKVPDADVDQAIEKGLAWLKSVRTPDAYHDITWDEIILYTLLHGGCAKDDPVFQDYLKKVVDKEPAKTYDVALAAMCLSELDKAGYRWKLEQYAQFLVDNQCKNGQWGYGEPIPLPVEKEAPKTVVATAASVAPRAVVNSGVSAPAGGAAPEPDSVIVAGAGVAVSFSAKISAAAVPPPPPLLYGARPPASGASRPGKTAVLSRKAVLQRRRSAEPGDNSNSQYAALGLRACAEAGLVIDPKCVQDALNWWVRRQSGDGGWGYNEKSPACRGSMTAGGVGAVAIYRWMSGQAWKGDPAVVKGCQWLGATWDLTKNPRAEAEKEGWAIPYQYYYLYGLERAGMIVGTDTIGTHDWYDEGAAYLVKSQTPEGMWSQGKVKNFLEGHSKVWDTCFAILFLRRATKPLPPLAKIFTQ